MMNVDQGDGKGFATAHVAMKLLLLPKKFEYYL